LLGVDQRREAQSYAACDRVLAVVPLEILVGLRVVLSELLDNVLAHVRVIFLDLPGDLQLVFGRHLRHLTTLSHQVEHELRNVTPGNRDVLDCAADDIALGARDDVSDTVARVDDGAGERAVRDAIRGPRRSERQYGLDGDVQPLDVERLEEDFCRLLAVLGRVQGRLSLREQHGDIVKNKRVSSAAACRNHNKDYRADQKKVMILRLRT
jgi:hypothetical protein